MNNERTVYRLAKPVKKGIMHLIFSRFLLFFILILLQVFLVVALYGYLENLLPYTTVIHMVFTFAMVLYLFNSGMDSSAKLTWMFLIALFPFTGSVLLFFTRFNFGHRALKEKVHENLLESRSVLSEDLSALRYLESEDPAEKALHAYLNRNGSFPVYTGTSCTYYPSGEEAFHALLQALSKAKRYIFLEFFIIEEGLLWGQVLEILIKKAREGVDVRILYDGMNEVFHVPSGYDRLLQREGIAAKIFAPIRPTVSSHYNYRDHRKILVIDGVTAFTGGMNLSDEYINETPRFGYWKDCALRLTGPAANSFTLMFLQLWNVGESSSDYSPCRLNAPLSFSEEPSSARPEGAVIPFSDCPLDSDKVGETVFLDILYRATRYVHIMTPYLILDGELEAALKYAAARGVEVSLILPGIPDKKTAYALAKSHYASLLSSGVKIYEFVPGFVHAKVMISDDLRAVVGTINLDYRSLYHHFECAAYLYKTPCLRDIENDFASVLSHCRRVTAETIRRERLLYKIGGKLLKLAAPLF